MAEPEADLLEAGVTFVVRGVQVNPAEHGYTAVHNYANYFWRPYLGNTAFALWELLLSFCYGDNDTVFPSISRLARMLTNSDHSRAIVIGRRKPVRAGADQAGAAGAASELARCEGALDVLRRERLVQVTCEGTGRTSSYTFRLCKTLPILRPEQVARLSPALQADHVIWLRRRGIDQRAYRQAFAGQAERAAAPPGTRDARARAARRVPPPAADRRRNAPCAAPAPAARAGADAPRANAAASHTGGTVQDTTNHPQEEPLWKKWWQDALAELRPQLLRGTFNTCLLSTRPLAFRDGVLSLRAASPLTRDLLQHRLLPFVQRALDDVSHGEVRGVQLE